MSIIFLLLRELNSNHNNNIQSNFSLNMISATKVTLTLQFQIYIHGPYELPDIASKNIRSEDGYFLQIYLSGLSIFTSNRAKSLGINQRKCRMFYESNLRHFPVYSYVLCRMECRAKLSQKLCGCIPHFYRKIGKYLEYYSKHNF